MHHGKENTGKLIENAISHALTKPQDLHPLTQPETLELLEWSVILHIIQTGPCPGKQTILAYHYTLPMRHVTCREPMKHLCLPMLM